MPYMIHTMTDETYAVNCTLTEQGGRKAGDHVFCCAVFEMLLDDRSRGGRMSFDRGTVGIYAAGAYHRIRHPAIQGKKEAA